MGLPPLLPPNRRLADYQPGAALPGRVVPATGLVHPPGPANFPTTTGKDESIIDLLRKIHQAILDQSDTRPPIIRSAAVTAAGQTLDWSSMGKMSRLIIRNIGVNSVFIAFDINGPGVQATRSDLSFQLQAQESLTLSNCGFYKVGCKCAAGQTGTVHAIAFQSNAGPFAGAIS